MKIAKPLTITSSALARIKSLAAAAAKSRPEQTELYYALKSLPPEHLADVHALYLLARPGTKSFNVALAAANKRNPEHVPGELADNHRFAECLRIGCKLHHDQS